MGAGEIPPKPPGSRGEVYKENLKEATLENPLYVLLITSLESLGCREYREYRNENVR